MQNAHQTAQSPELQNQIAQWRIKAAEGTMTLDEYREAIRVLRNGRLSASQAAKASKVKTAKIAKSADELLSDLGKL